MIHPRSLLLHNAEQRAGVFQQRVVGETDGGRLAGRSEGEAGRFGSFQRQVRQHIAGHEDELRNALTQGGEATGSEPAVPEFLRGTGWMTPRSLPSQPARAEGSQLTVGACKGGCGDASARPDQFPQRSLGFGAAQVDGGGDVGRVRQGRG